MLFLVLKISVFIFYLQSSLAGGYSSPSFLPPAWPVSLTLADQRRKHNAHIHAASGSFYVRVQKATVYAR